MPPPPPKSFVDQLVSQLGLDKETITSQIIPFLETFDSSQSLASHLQDLLGTDPRSLSIITSYVESKFPPKPIPSSTPATNSLQPSVGSGVSSNPKGKKKSSSSKILPPKASNLHARSAAAAASDRNSSPSGSDLSSAFGQSGSIYFKKREDEGDEAFFSGFPKGGKRSNKERPDKYSDQSATTTTTTRSARKEEGEGKERLSRKGSELESHLHRADVAEEMTPKSDQSSTSSATVVKEVLAPTKEMLALDVVIEELTSDEPIDTIGPDGKRFKFRRCFCQGRSHPPSPHVPLCLSCGLVLCSAIRPSPLSPSSSCPSCSTTPLLSQSQRYHLISKLTTERELLVEQQRIQVQLLREERANNRNLKEEAEKRRQGMFPTLASSSHEPQDSSNGAVPHRRGLDAKGLKGLKAGGDPQRTAKVLSLNMKTHKVTVSRPKKAKVKEVTVTAKGRNEAGGERSEGEVQRSAEDEGEQDEEEEEEEEEPSLALDGTLLIKDEDDDGFAVFSAIRPPINSGPALEGGKGKDLRSKRWDNPTLREQGFKLKYLGQEERKEVMDAFHEGEDQEEEEEEGGKETEGKESSRDIRRRRVPGSAEDGKGNVERREGTDRKGEERRPNKIPGYSASDPSSRKSKGKGRDGGKGGKAGVGGGDGGKNKGKGKAK